MTVLINTERFIWTEVAMGRWLCPLDTKDGCSGHLMLVVPLMVAIDI